MCSMPYYIYRNRFKELQDLKQEVAKLTSKVDQMQGDFNIDDTSYKVE